MKIPQDISRTIRPNRHVCTHFDVFSMLIASKKCKKRNEVGDFKHFENVEDNAKVLSSLNRCVKRVQAIL